MTKISGGPSAAQVIFSLQLITAKIYAYKTKVQKKTSSTSSCSYMKSSKRNADLLKSHICCNGQSLKFDQIWLPHNSGTYKTQSRNPRSDLNTFAHFSCQMGMSKLLSPLLPVSSCFCSLYHSPGNENLFLITLDPNPIM
ncbi:hypothetical protein SLE2022_284350 [Rubroshorea leprosula]